MSFNFNPQEEWTPGSQILGAGNHVTRIVDIDADTRSSGNHPQVVVRTGNEQGEITNWIVISSPSTFGKFTNLVLACDVPEAKWPKPGVDFDEQTGKVSQEYCDRNLYGKEVGTVVRKEPDNRPERMGEMRDRVAGYCKASEVKSHAGNGDGKTASGMQFDAAASVPSSSEGEPEIPF